MTGMDMLFFGISPIATGGSGNAGPGFRDLRNACGTAADTGRTGLEIAATV